MAEELDDGEFWLPSQFLTEEDILTDFGASTPTNSDLRSPVEESVTETESDGDEFLAELTRRMTRSSFRQDRGSADDPKGLVLSGSPQSTLFPVGDGSSRGSPTGPDSPPPAAKGGYFKASDAASLDLLHAAAGEVAKLRMRNEQQQKGGTGYFDSSRGGFLYPPLIKQTTPAVSLPPDFHAPPFFSHQSKLPHHHQQQQAFQLPQLWGGLERMKQGNLSENGGFFRSEHFHNRPLGLSPAAWPPLQRPLNRQPLTPASAQNLSGTKRESVGTGVFLPRRVNVNPDPAESRKIKNKHDSTGRSRGQNNGFHSSGPRRSSENAQRPVTGSNPTEIQLPSEWTY